MTFKQFQAELEELRCVDLEELQLMRIIAKTNYETGKFAMDSGQRVSSIFIIGAMASIIYGQLVSRMYSIIILSVLTAFLIPYLIWMTVGYRKRQKGYWRLMQINLVLQEKTGKSWDDV